MQSIDHTIGGLMMKKLRLISIFVLFSLLLCMMPVNKGYAAGATAVSFGEVNYETLTLQVYNNNNNVVYYSTDNSNWSEIEGGYHSTAKAYTFDISWVASTTDVTLYFKGDVVKTVKTITLPMQNSSINVEYDKVEGEFTFSEVEESDYFEWRKATDYYWNKVSFSESSSSYQTFLTTMESLRTKGAKLIIRTPQVIGLGAGDVGMRPSAEITITIPARAAAPTVKVNSSKLTLTTTVAMEYYDLTSDLWMECDGDMPIEDIAPKALYDNGGKSVTLFLRKSATASAPFSKTQKLIIPGQAGAPTIGGSSSDVTYYYLNSKLVMQFNNASATKVYEYTIVKEDKEFNITSASWKSVTTTSLMTLSKSLVPIDSTIYVRKKGTDENTTKNVNLSLSSAINSFVVTY
jgi:hypothetical protein